MTAVQALWDGEWERVHAAPRQGALTPPAHACCLAGCCMCATAAGACAPAWLGQLGGRLAVTGGCGRVQQNVGVRATLVAAVLSAHITICPTAITAGCPLACLCLCRAARVPGQLPCHDLLPHHPGPPDLRSLFLDGSPRGGGLLQPAGAGSPGWRSTCWARPAGWPGAVRGGIAGRGGQAATPGSQGAAAQRRRRGRGGAEAGLRGRVAAAAAVAGFMSGALSVSLPVCCRLFFGCS